jgi:hypothetical protein
VCVFALCIGGGKAGLRSCCFHAATSVSSLCPVPCAPCPVPCAPAPAALVRPLTLPRAGLLPVAKVSRRATKEARRVLKAQGFVVPSVANTAVGSPLASLGLGIRPVTSTGPKVEAIEDALPNARVRSGRGMDGSACVRASMRACVRAWEACVPGMRACLRGVRAWATAALVNWLTGVAT